MAHYTLLQLFLAFFLSLFAHGPQQARIPGPGGAPAGGGGGGVGTGPCVTSNINLGNGINCVQAAVNLSGSGTNVLAYPKGSVTSGNCLFVLTASDSNVSSTAADSQGSYAQTVTANEPTAPGTANILFRKATATGANTVTVTNAGGSAMVIMEVSGLTNCANDKNASSVNSATTTFTTGTTAATTVATELTLSWFFNDVSAGTFSLGVQPNLVLLNSSTGGGAGTITFAQAYTVSSTGTQNSTSVVSASSSGPAMISTFN